MRRRWTRLLWGLLCGLILTACANSNPLGMVTTVQLPPVVTEKLEYPAIDPSALTCALDPVIVPNISLDTDVPYPGLEDAWRDCYTKLKYIHDLVSTWPK